MEELELLKKDWNKDSESFKTYSEKDLFAMIKGRSVSVAKTLLMIGVIEIILWNIYHLYRKQYFFDLKNVISILFIVSILYIYIRIRKNESTASLIKSIINLRTVILGYTFITISIIFIARILLYCDSNFVWYDTAKSTAYNIGLNTGYFAFFILIYIIYKKSYGPLLRKLKANYAELTKLEESAE